MSTQELLDLHAAGILGSTTYDMLESELAARGVAAPTRPNKEEPVAETRQKKCGQLKQTYLVFPLSLFFASVVQNLMKVLFLAMAQLPFIQGRPSAHEFLSIAGILLRIATFFLVFIISYRFLKRYIESGKIA